MPYPLQKPPRGLLEVLRLKQAGKQPEWFSEQLVPVIDGREFYASDILAAFGGAAQVGALANLTRELTLTSSFGVKAISGNLTIGAAAATNVYLEIGVLFGAIGGSLAEYIVLQQVFIAQAAIGAILGIGCVLPNWVLPAGTIVRCRANGTAAGVDHSLDVSTLVENFNP